MYNQNFTNFPLLTTTPQSGDYLVGYKADGSDEFRTTIQNLQLVKSDTTNIPSASAVNNIVMISMTNFMALTAKDPKTAYLIVDDSQIIV